MSASFIEISGGVTAPEGFLAGSAYCGIKGGNLDKPDLAMIASQGPTVAAATFTTNKVKAAPVRVSAVHLRSNDIRAIIANSGNANACTGPIGLEHSKRMATATAQALGLKDRQVLVCSTGRGDANRKNRGNHPSNARCIERRGKYESRNSHYDKRFFCQGNRCGVYPQ